MEILRDYLESWPRFLPFLFVLIVTVVLARTVSFLVRSLGQVEPADDGS
ncbi:MAG TPA: hypothetical protein VKA63_03000 [Candidatus Krumholzibacteria bacterium]|nr:hypothetical protein [Candidatus Krumholzibacteria bacterium]